MTLPRFVILEHDRDGVHWDVMLERGGVLATWSVGSPIVPGRGLDATKLPDHRVAYLDYEGPISGDRGVVRRLARGHYLVRHWDGDRVGVTLVGDQLSGELELSRAGGAAGWVFRLLGKVD
jgi:hypothetical protein